MRKTDVIKAQAFSVDDASMVLNAARTAKGGIDAVQESVAGPIRKWMTEEAMSLIDELGAKGNEGDLKELALMCRNVGVLLSDQRLFDLQERYTRKAVELDKRQYGDDHPEVVTKLNNLARQFQVQGKYEAGHIYRRSLATNMKSFGSNNLKLICCAPMRFV